MSTRGWIGSSAFDVERNRVDLFDLVGVLSLDDDRGGDGGRDDGSSDGEELLALEQILDLLHGDASLFGLTL